jgi:hypothetical protein
MKTYDKNCKENSRRDHPQRNHRRRLSTRWCHRESSTHKSLNSNKVSGVYEFGGRKNEIEKLTGVFDASFRCDSEQQIVRREAL